MSTAWGNHIPYRHHRHSGSCRPQEIYYLFRQSHFRQSASFRVEVASKNRSVLAPHLPGEHVAWAATSCHKIAAMRWIGTINRLDWVAQTTVHRCRRSLLNQAPEYGCNKLITTTAFCVSSTNTILHAPFYKRSAYIHEAIGLFCILAVAKKCSVPASCSRCRARLT